MCAEVAEDGVEREGADSDGTVFCVPFSPEASPEMETDSATSQAADDGTLQRRRWKPNQHILVSEGRILDRLDQLVQSFNKVLQEGLRGVPATYRSVFKTINPWFKARSSPPTI